MRYKTLPVIASILFGLITFGGLVIIGSSNEIVAQGDTEPPHLVSVQVEPTFVDTTSSSVPMTVTFRMTDNLSGAYYASISFARFSEDGGSAQPSIDWYRSPLMAVSGTITNGLFILDDELPQHSPHGRWYLSSVLIFDSARNTCTWQREKWGAPSSDVTCVAVTDLPYFVNVADSGPPSTPTPTPTPTITPDYIATAVVATLTAIAEVATPQPCELYLPSIR
jgi:hypothetical protein